MSNKKGLIDRLAEKYLLEKPVAEKLEPNPELRERKIDTLAIISVSISAFLGAFFVVILYLPQYWYPDFFNKWMIKIPVFDFDLAVITNIYAIILVMIELYLLTILSMVSVRRISNICGFPQITDPDHQSHIEALLSVGLEKPDKRILKIGLNPYDGMSKFAFVLFMLIFKLKALFSNIVLKIVVKRLLGRYTLRMVMDMAGAPVYAFWDAWATWTVIKEAKIRTLAPEVIKKFVTQLHKQYANDTEFKSMIYDVLQFVAITKRDYHYNHYLLAKEILTVFNIPIEKDHDLNPQFKNNLKTIKPEVKNGLVKLIVFGVLLDGVVSIREVKYLKRMNVEVDFNVDIHKVKTWTKALRNGRSIDEFIYQD